MARRNPYHQGPSTQNFDHLDLATLKRLHHRDAPLIVTPLGNDAIIRRHIGTARVVSGDWGDRFSGGDDIEVDVVPANHWSSRGVRDRRMALWAGFMIHTPVGLIYFAGRHRLRHRSHLPRMRERYGRPDLALLPIGAYSPEWFMSVQHCNPAEAVQIMLDLEVQQALGIHWCTFRLTDEARDEPARKLIAADRDNRIGSCIDLDLEAAQEDARTGRVGCVDDLGSNLIPFRQELGLPTIPVKSRSRRFTRQEDAHRQAGQRCNLQVHRIADQRSAREHHSGGAAAEGDLAVRPGDDCRSGSAA